MQESLLTKCSKIWKITDNTFVARKIIINLSCLELKNKNKKERHSIYTRWSNNIQLRKQYYNYVAKLIDTRTNKANMYLKNNLKYLV